MKMIIDFIKSWLSYPKLRKWFKDGEYPWIMSNRFRYAVNHCRKKRKIEKAMKNNDFSEWICKFQQDPISKELI